MSLQGQSEQQQSHAAACCKQQRRLHCRLHSQPTWPLCPLLLPLQQSLCHVSLFVTLPWRLQSMSSDRAQPFKSNRKEIQNAGLDRAKKLCLSEGQKKEPTRVEVAVKKVLRWYTTDSKVKIFLFISHFIPNQSGQVLCLRAQTSSQAPLSATSPEPPNPNLAMYSITARSSLLLLLVLAAGLHLAHSCTTNADCSFAGQCVQSHCQCMQGWTGASCNQLANVTVPVQRYLFCDRTVSADFTFHPLSTILPAAAFGWTTTMSGARK